MSQLMIRAIKIRMAQREGDERRRKKVRRGDVDVLKAAIGSLSIVFSQKEKITFYIRLPGHITLEVPLYLWL
jgi:hypothetical protein